MVLQHDPYDRLESEKAVLLNEMQQIRSKAVGSLQKDLSFVIRRDDSQNIDTMGYICHFHTPN